MNPYIQSLRLRTLPLSVSGIILGTGIVLLHQPEAVTTQQWLVFALAIATTLSLQILSNLCNELGDAQKGTDADQKGRAAYGLQRGAITPKQIKGMIGLFIVLCLLFGVALIYSAFGSLSCTPSLVLGVFVFFGLLSTIGSYYLLAQSVTWEVVWYGVAVGLPCVGVLNLNNIRDMANDRKHGKHTFASLLGPTGSRVYHTLLLIGCLTIFALYGHFWCLCIIPVWVWHLWYIWSHTDKLDKQMPVLMFTTLIVVLLALI